MALTLKILITAPPPSGLGYCCVWVFFREYKQTALIAARLGVTTRAVRMHKQACAEGQFICEGKGNCMKGKL